MKFSLTSSLAVTFAGLALAAVAAGPAAGVTVNQNPPVIVSAPSTLNFVKKMVDSTRFEIRSSRLALERSQNEAVREFARAMILDHTRAGRILEALVEETEQPLLLPIPISPEHAATMRQLETAADAEFDALYLAAQVQAHQEAVALVGAYASNGSKKEFQTFAQDLLPTLEIHLRHAQHLVGHYQ